MGMAGRPKIRARREKNLARMNEPGFWDDFFEKIAGGISLKMLCEIKGIPYTQIMGQIKKDPDLQSHWDWAKKTKALRHIEMIEEDADEIRDGRLDPLIGKTVISTRQWLAERLDPKEWGNKHQHDVKVLDVTQLHLQALQAINEAQPIEGEATEVHDEDGA